MKHVCIRERSYYDVASFSRLCKLNEEVAYEQLKTLCSKNVVRYRTEDDFDEFDTDGDRLKAGKYQFRFVGLALTDKLVVVVYPKYMSKEPSSLQLRMLLRVIRKRSGSYTLFDQYSQEGLIGDKRISLILELLESYFEYGEYSNYVEQLEDNGFGGISWERTISSFTPYLSNGQPVYFDFKTRKTRRNETDLITRIHHAVLSDCFKELRECNLLEVFEVDDTDISHEELDELGDIEPLIGLLQSERSRQFMTWKLHVLNLLIIYLEGALLNYQNSRIQCLGTTSFHVDWEKACKTCFGDMLNRKISDIGIELNGPWKALNRTRLIDVIPTPEWHVVNMDGQDISCSDPRTFIPDLVTVQPDERAFYILDAKYYVPILRAGKKLVGQPGVESVAKQFLYQEAYSKFVIDNKFSKVVNAFFVPTCEQNARLIGTVTIPGVLDSGCGPFSSIVEMWAIPADLLFSKYLSGERMSLPSFGGLSR